MTSFTLTFITSMPGTDARRHKTVLHGGRMWRMLQTINRTHETNEKEAKDENMWRREERSAEKADALVCPEEGCTFVVRNTSGLANHCRQQYSLLRSVVCPHCQKSFIP